MLEYLTIKTLERMLIELNINKLKVSLDSVKFQDVISNMHEISIELKKRYEERERKNKK